MFLSVDPPFAVSQGNRRSIASGEAGGYTRNTVVLLLVLVLLWLSSVLLAWIVLQTNMPTLFSSTPQCKDSFRCDDRWPRLSQSYPTTYKSSLASWTATLATLVVL